MQSSKSYLLDRLRDRRPAPRWVPILLLATIFATLAAMVARADHGPICGPEEYFEQFAAAGGKVLRYTGEAGEVQLRIYIDAYDQWLLVSYQSPEIVCLIGKGDKWREMEPAAPAEPSKAGST